MDRNIVNFELEGQNFRLTIDYPQDSAMISMLYSFGSHYLDLYIINQIIKSNRLISTVYSGMIQKNENN